MPMTSAQRVAKYRAKKKAEKLGVTSENVTGIKGVDRADAITQLVTLYTATLDEDQRRDLHWETCSKLMVAILRTSPDYDAAEVLAEFSSQCLDELKAA